MKKITLCAFLLFVTATAFSQDMGGAAVWLGSRAQLFKTYSPFTATSDDTTGWLSLTTDPVLKTHVLMARESRLIGIATDSIAADVYVVGRNGSLTSLTATYADSIVGTSNTLNTVVIVLRGPDTDRLSGMTEVKVGTVFRASGQGTTSGRTMKWYLEWIR